ncbi:MAG: bifunctional 5,10-methylenetetrahydrofolate dehydrogenase/5,10-methenyltetrahydrofolate cyclohydrolase [Candidatus Levyibacteriota bacterium]
MKIDGKKLAEKVLSEIRTELRGLPQITLAIVTLGQEDAWEHYVSQKIKLASELGALTELINIKDPTEEKLIEIIKKLNKDPKITGIIVQRPLTKHIKKDKVIYAVSPGKDIDGFIKNSHFKPPVWLAVKDILSEIAKIEGLNLSKFLKDRTITVIGKGETAGQPVIDGLKKLDAEPNVVDSKTENSGEIIKSSDIIISAVGKSEVFATRNLKNGVTIIGIGLHRQNGKLKPDFDEEKVSKTAKYYSPTPGGVGPLNLAYLFKNLVLAAKLPIDES